MSEHRGSAGCDMEKLCTDTERQAFVTHFENRLNCFVGYVQHVVIMI